jgi:hypothetical protein
MYNADIHVPILTMYVQHHTAAFVLCLFPSILVTPALLFIIVPAIVLLALGQVKLIFTLTTNTHSTRTGTSSVT